VAGACVTAPSNDSDLVVLISSFRMYGVSLMDAYRAYNDTDFLKQAQAVWDHIIASQITDEEAASGSKNGTSIQKTCNDGELRELRFPF
jgi:hypothetical protein